MTGDWHVCTSFRSSKTTFSNIIKLSMSASLSCPISVCSVCSVVSVCSDKSGSVNKSSSSVHKSKGPKQVKIIMLWFIQVSHNCSFSCRYSPCCKLVKLGHYSVLRPRILHLLLALYDKTHMLQVKIISRLFYF